MGRPPATVWKLKPKSLWACQRFLALPRSPLSYQISPPIMNGEGVIGGYHFSSNG